MLHVGTCVRTCKSLTFYIIIMFTYYRALSVQTSRLSEDLHAREEQVKSLLQQLK